VQRMDQVVLITPSEDYVRSLPRKQISDMKDFKFYGADQDARVAYWMEISKRSLELGQELSDLIAAGDILKHIRPYTS